MSILFIVSTPIGNLEDITYRAVRILNEADLVLCEDTRVTRNLLDHYDIKTPMMSYHQHSGGAKIKKIISFFEDGKDLALVTDAGTPGISDPGNELIEVILKSAGVENFQTVQIIPIPGPSALTAAVSIAGVSADEFVFLGFLPHKNGRQKKLREIADSDRAVVFYESKHRIIKTLEQLHELIVEAEAFSSSRSERQIVVCRELTKIHETVYRGSIWDVLEMVKGDSVKGEYTVVMGSKPKVKSIG